MLIKNFVQKVEHGIYVAEYNMITVAAREK